MGLAVGAWRVLMVIKDGFVLMFMLLFFGAIYLALSAGPNAGSVHDGALLLNLKGSIVEQRRQGDPQALLSGNSAPQEIVLHDLVRGLDAAAKDDRVKAVVLDLSGFNGGGQVALERVGAALDEVRAAKKSVIAYSGAYDDHSYLLAAHASEIWLEPMGFAAFPGPGGSQLYYKGLIDKLGATVHVYRVGKYKSFVEPYTRTEASPEAKQADQELLSAIWSDWQANVHAARPQAQLQSYIANPQAIVDANKGDTAAAARAAHIVDQVGDRYAFGDYVAKLVGDGDDHSAGSFREIKLNDWLAANPAPKSGGEIGVVTVAGEIIDGKSVGDQAGGDTIAQLIEKATNNDSVKALVLRIDSPGGSVAASEKIRLALVQAKKKGLPIIASMGSVAASGGYWVSTPAAKVFAEPGTITGSIGVFGIIPTFEHSITKLGITHDGVFTTPLSGQPDIFAGTTPQFDALIQTSIDNTYQRFIGLVAAAHHLSVSRVNDIAQGRVWAGSNAKTLQLVDAFGTLDDAVAEAARAAKLDPSAVHVRYLEPDGSWLTTLFSGLQQNDDAVVGDPISHMAQARWATLDQALRDTQRMLNGSAVQARCLECPLPPATPTKHGVIEQLIARWIGA